MKKYFRVASVMVFLGTAGLYAQVGMTTNNPNKDAVLDLNIANSSNTKGLLLPKVALTATDIAAPMAAHVAGMKVYNTATAGTGATAVIPGEYINNGIKWIRVASIANSVDNNDVWLLGGNTTGGLKQLGTKDDQPLPFIIDNTNAGLVAKTSTAVGYSTLSPTATGLSNTAVGVKTLKAVTSGNNNTAVGDSAMLMNQVSVNNTAFGDQALMNSYVGYYIGNVVVGSGASDDKSVNGVVLVGNKAGLNGNPNTMNGNSDNVGLGAHTLRSYQNGNSLAIGYKALNSITPGTSNIGVGYAAMAESIYSVVSIGFGSNALLKNTGNNNIGIGYGSLPSASGRDNIAVGSGSMNYNTTGASNVSAGKNVMYSSSTTSNNIAIGNSAMYNLVTGDNNVFVGNNAGRYYGVNQPLTSATTSVFLGSQTGPEGSGQKNQIVIGYNAKGRGDNTVRIGNTAITKIGGYKGWSNPSDFRLKKDIKDSEFGLNFITKLRPVVYFMKSGPKDLQTGFIAQEVEAAAISINYEFSGIVKPKNADDFYSLRYSEFVVPLVKAVQEQQKEVAVIDTKLLDIESRLQKLESIVNVLAKKK